MAHQRRLNPVRLAARQLHSGWPAYLALPMNASADSAAALQLRRLRWRARRGLLENDLILARFFDRCADRLNDTDIKALNRLLALADHDLLDLLLARTPAPRAAGPQTAMTRVLALLRSNSSLF